MNINKLKALLKTPLTAQEDKEIRAELHMLLEQYKTLEAIEIKNGVSMYGSYFCTVKCLY